MHPFAVSSAALSSLAAVAMTPAALAAPVQQIPQDGPFQRVATFPIFENSDVESETVAEIVAASEDGNTLIYTDAELERLGFVDITDPHNPLPGGTLALPGEPTSVAVLGPHALVCVNTSLDFVNTSGELLVVEIDTRTVVTTLPLGGQPDAIAVAPSGNYAAIAIENERDEDLGDGEPPQLPAGFLTILDPIGPPAEWTTRDVSLIGVADLFPNDPEPEFVDINGIDVAAVTLQENNHVAFVDLPSGQVTLDFSCGTVDLTNVDDNENDLVELNANLNAVPREPDAITFVTDFTVATANEGDLFGGSRGFTLWTVTGDVGFDSGASVDQATVRLGHYPESRSENKGNEPEGIEYADFDGQRLLFVGSERSNVVFVYEQFGSQVLGAGLPFLRQALPTGVGPEGLLALPERDLFVVSCEVDARDDKIRASLMIYERTNQTVYPTVFSGNEPGTGLPIPFSALSGLASLPANQAILLAVPDSFYQRSRVFGIDSSTSPARVFVQREIFDTNGVLAAHLADLAASLPDTGDFSVDALINPDGSVNLDLEGVTVSPNGGVWLCSEGAGNLLGGISDPEDRPFESPNLLIRIDGAGNISDVVGLPTELVLNQFRFGFEGLAEVDGAIYVAFQRAWTASGDPEDRARIGRYDLYSGEWSYAYYPLSSPASPNGGWVGLSEIVSTGKGEFVVVERDNQGGPDAAIKQLSSFSIDGISFGPESSAGSFDVVTKSLVIDLLADGVFAPFAGLTPEKIEGLALRGDGFLIVNDNDGVDDNSGETLLIEVQ